MKIEFKASISRIGMRFGFTFPVDVQDKVEKYVDKGKKKITVIIEDDDS